LYSLVVMKIDLHLHTNFSHDGLSSPKEIVDAAIKKGLDVICITDHSEIKGAFEAIKYALGKNILVLPGIEIMSQAGDILAINVKELVPDGLSTKDTINEIHQQGGIAVAPHPFNWPFGKFRGTLEELKTFDAIECFNANAFRFVNKKALNFAKKYNLAHTAGSDAHNARYVGRGYLSIASKITSELDAINAIMGKTGEIIGKVLNFRQLIRNAQRSDIIQMFDWYRIRKKNK